MFESALFKSGNPLAVWLTKELELTYGPVSIHREGCKIIIKEVPANASLLILEVA